MADGEYQILADLLSNLIGDEQDDITTESVFDNCCGVKDKTIIIILLIIIVFQLHGIQKKLDKKKRC